MRFMRLRYLIAVGAVGLMGVPNFVFAGRDIPLQIGILGHSTVANIAEYIAILYQYLVGFAGLMAVVMIMYAGMKWIFAGGDRSKIGAAQDIINHAVIGLVLALGSYLILNTINPALIELKVPQVDEVGRRLLPGRWCPNTAEFEGDFACGRQFTPQDDRRLGGLCFGSHCAQGTSCRRSRNGQVYACMNAANCPSSCEAVNSMPGITSDTLLRIACGSDLCEATIPNGCVVLERSLGSLNHPNTECVDAARQGDHCNANEDCGRGLFCVTARGYNSCEPSPPSNLPNWEDCDLNLTDACGPREASPHSKCVDKLIGLDGYCSNGGEGAACESGTDCQSGLRCHDCDGLGNFEDDKCGSPGMKTCDFYSTPACDEHVDQDGCYL